MRFPLLCLLAVVLLAPLRGAEPFFKKGDVIALVGGEDMVVASEYGYLELLLTRALPDYRLRFRNLAWEGDTVFEQRRDLNFPTWEEQLDKIGATVVIAQFGQMESLAGKEKLPEFIAAYEKLIERFSAGGKRRVVRLGPTPREPIMPLTKEANRSQAEYSTEASATTLRVSALSIDLITPFVFFVWKMAEDEGRTDVIKPEWLKWSRDGFHLSAYGHRMLAKVAAETLEPRAAGFDRLSGLGRNDNIEGHSLLALIRAKNRLWFDYWRPQNWAFLAGDRTAQPSSRDHLDPTKRWFPPEREAFLPLIEAKEKEIDALAQQLAKP